MIELIANNLHWLPGVDEINDYCAHGGFELWVEGCQMLHSESDWSLGAAALHLLRALEHDHSGSDRVCNHLVPCCGHFMTECGDEYPFDVAIPGCPGGLNWEVERQGAEIALM